MSVISAFSQINDADSSSLSTVRIEPWCGRRPRPPTVSAAPGRKSSGLSVFDFRPVPTILLSSVPDKRLEFLSMTTTAATPMNKNNFLK